MDSELLTEQEVAAEYGLNLNTLRDWRYRKVVLPYIKFGNHQTAAVRYRRSDIEAVIDRNTIAVR